MCDALAPSCLRLAPLRSLHTTLFLTHCLREEAGDAWASEVQHNEEYTRTHTQSPSCTRVLEHLDANTQAFVICRQTPLATWYLRAHTYTQTNTTHWLCRIFPKHQTSILLSSQTNMTADFHTDSLSYLVPHPHPPWHWVTQIQQVTLGQWAVNELILITVNSITSERVCLHVCWPACMQGVKLERLNSRKREVHTSALSSNLESLIVHVDRLGWWAFRFKALFYFFTSSSEHLIIRMVIGVWIRGIAGSGASRYNEFNGCSLNTVFCLHASFFDDVT